jgi:methionyl aminopeptidase
MSIFIKTEEQIEYIREAGHRLGAILASVAKRAVPGVTALELDTYAEELIRAGGDIPAFKNYKPDMHHKPFPSSLCVSVNNEVVHGMPIASKVLQVGDIVSLDLGLSHKGYFADHAVTLVVGSTNEQQGTDKEKKLLKVTEGALYAGIDMARAGNRVGDIGFTIARFAKQNGLGIVRELSGHGVGIHIHEDPYIPNYGRKGTGALLKPGMIIAIEPMFTLGSPAIDVLPDGYTVVTRDRSKAAHFEHTVLITHGDPEILTEVV